MVAKVKRNNLGYIDIIIEGDNELPKGYTAVDTDRGRIIASSNPSINVPRIPKALNSTNPYTNIMLRRTYHGEFMVQVVNDKIVLKQTKVKYAKK